MRSDLESLGHQQQPERITNGGIVIDDMNNRYVAH